MAEKKLSLRERLKAKAAAAARAAKNAGGAIKDKTESGVEAVKNSGAGEKLKDSFESAVNKFQEVDWEAVGGRMKDFGEGTADWTKDNITKLDTAIKSEDFQGFLDNAGDKLAVAKPLGGAIKDSIGDMVDDPEAMKQILGGAVLTGGANIPYAIAQEVMSDPEVQGTFSELVDDVLPDGAEASVDSLLALSNSDLAKILKDPSMTSALQTVLQKPEMREMLQDKLSELTPNDPAIDPQPPTNNPEIQDFAPAQ